MNTCALTARPAKGPVRVAFLLSIVWMGLLSLGRPLAAQTPASGTVSRPSPALVTWCGGTACGAAGNQTSATGNPVAASCSNSKCEVFTLTVGAVNAGDLVSIGITWPNSLNDFDLHVYDSSGTQVASSANGAPQNSEQVTFPAVSGTYAVKVLFYTVVNDNYAGTATLLAGPPPRTASYATGGFTFSANVSVRAPAAASDGEPSNRTDFQGNAYTSAIRGVPAGVDLWAFDLNASSKTFDAQLRSPHYRGQPDSFPASQALDVGADGGGDVDLAVGFQLPNNPASMVPNLSVVSLVAANVSSARSQDRGVTFLKDPAANLIPADDRQWIEALGGDNVFLLYRAPVPATGLFVQTSSDGGFSFAPTSISLVNASGTTPGYVSADQTRRLVYAGHSSSKGMFVSRAQFDPSNPLAPMVFKQSTVDNTTSHRHLFDVVKVGRDGTVYACWSDDKNIYLASSVDQGITWSQKVQVNNPNFAVPDRFETVQTAKINLFPWCEAGSDGRVDIVWYGTTNAANDDNADWNVFFAQTLNAKDSTPTFQQVAASDHFIHAGNISEGGLTGSANRNLLDYFQVSLDPQGAAFISFADDHNDFTGHTYVTRQLSGPSAFAGANGTGMVATVTPTAPPAQAPSAPQVIDFAHDAVAGLLAVISTDNPLDILSIRYGCEITPDSRTLVTATMKVSDLSVVLPAANWRMNFTANALAGLADRGNQFFLRASTDTVTPTFTYGTTARNSDGSLTNTTRGSADVGFFDTANNAATVKVDIAKLSLFANPALGPGTTFIGLRGSTFTTGANVIRDIARGGAVPVGDPLQGAFSGGMGSTQFAIANCATSSPPPPPPPPPPPQKNISISGVGSIGPDGKDEKFAFNADNRPAGHLDYQDNAAGIDLVSTAITFFHPPEDNGTCASFGGTARLNGDPNHIFTVNACDNGEPGAGNDTFQISIDANYTRSGTLTRGNIQLHEK